MERKKKTEMPETQQLSHKQVVNESIVAQAPVEKTIPNSTNKYYEIPLQYNYGTAEKPELKDFLVECPELPSPTGIVNYPQNGKDSWGIMVTLDSKNPIIKEFVNVLTGIYVTAGIHLSKVKGAVKIAEFDPRNPSATGFKSPVYYSRDKNTGDIIQGRDPSFFLKLIKYGKGAFETKTLFTEINIEIKVPWELIQQAEITLVPLLHIEKIYIGGGKASLQIKTKSGIITSVRGKNASSSQIATSKKLLEEPGKELSLKEQIAKIYAERQDLFLPQTPKVQDGKGDGSGGGGGGKAEVTDSTGKKVGPKVSPLDVDISKFLNSVNISE